MFPFFLPIMLGAAGGALMNKKNPFEGALLGGALGAAGGAGLGAMGAGEGALTAAQLEAQQAAAAEGMLSPGLVGTQAGGYGPASAQIVERGVPMNAAGMQGMKPGGQTYGLLDTAGRAANTASTIRGLMGPEQTSAIPVAPPFTTGSPAMPGGAYQQIQQQRMVQNQANEALRARRQRNIGLIG